MPTVRMPSLLHRYTNGAATVDASGQTLRAVLDDLVRQFPALRDHLFEGDVLRQDIMLAVGGDEARDLDIAIPDGAEVHVLPSIAGG